MATTPVPPTAEHEQIRMVVVDDDAGIRMLIEVSVSLDHRFELVGSAATASEAMSLLDTWQGPPIDLVLLDVTLPDRDGIDALPDVREAARGACIALFTGWDDSATHDRATAAGADGIFPKDGSPQRLLEGLAVLCASRQAARG